LLFLTTGIKKTSVWKTVFVSEHLDTVQSQFTKCFALVACFACCMLGDAKLQLCLAGLWSRSFLGGVGFLTTLGVGVGFFCPTPTPKVQWDHFYITLLSWEFLLKWYNFFKNFD